MKQEETSSVQKALQFGTEFEFFTLDSEGRMINGGDQLIKKVNSTNKDIDIIKESGKNMVEIKSFPSKSVRNAIHKTLNDFETVLHCAEQENQVLYCYGTYPGSFTPELNLGSRAKIVHEIFGKQRNLISGRCLGLHCHYSLPWGVFDHKKKMIKNLINSKNKQSMVNMYNLFIAMDPALCTFTQSSPFYQGKYLGKDSRTIVWRGGDVFNYPEGLYANYQNIGMLPPYKITGTDLLQMINDRFEEWKTEVEKVGADIKTSLKHGSPLDIIRNPIKLSSYGTIEQRGMSMNHPRIIIAVAVLIEHICKEVQEKFLQIMPSDIGLNEPFKKEENVIYIPPHTHVRFELQPKSASKGLEDEGVYNYCNGLLKLGKAFVPEEKLPLLKPLEEMLKEKKTVSDLIIKDAKKMGLDFENITNSQAAELALKHSKDLFKEVIMTKQAIKSLE